MLFNNLRTRFLENGASTKPRYPLLIQIVTVAIITTLAVWFYLGAFDRFPIFEKLRSFGSSPQEPKQPFGDREQRLKAHHASQSLAPHPIDRLVRDSEKVWKDTMNARTHNLEEAAEAYRKRRGRHPPPQFDAWYRYAEDRNAVMIEEFFDQIYHDLNPFWGVEPDIIRRQASHYVNRIRIRKGKARFRNDDKMIEWMNLWHNLIDTINGDLPDIDMAINAMDEPRIMAPWETINELVQKGEESKTLETKGIKSEYSRLGAWDKTKPEPHRPEWDMSGPYWKYVAPACPPDTPGRDAEAPGKFIKDPHGPLPLGFPRDSHEGYVRNFTMTKDPCNRTELRELHGSYIEPTSLQTTTELFPIFGGSKLTRNNDILLPAAMYWSDDPRYSGGPSHGASWDTKYDRTIWRGAASGGRNHKENWRRFQRHRFVSMMNGTSVEAVETGKGPDPNDMVLPSEQTYNLSATQNGHLVGEWLSEFSDAAFVNLICFPQEEDERRCSYTDEFFKVVKPFPMKRQYAYKYLPDIDGNSFSGRYRGFLLSTSLPIKATMYKEWHDTRLQPWVHFVPMDNTFVDFYGILDYYVGSWDKLGHDKAARKIALEGKRWAEKVLRKEDMQIYVYRLLLEYARICNDEREVLGWIEDLTSG